ncbi:MAG: ABC transporter ATP-binding protein [Leptospirales bacterium]|nr:ABC transporter ATP-binding protein [Leptospirales bacterium]
MDRLTVEGLHFSYGSKSVLNGVDFTINRGEIVTVLGANGSGKSTLIRCMLGFHFPQKGEIKFDGKNIRSFTQKEMSLRVAYVPQTHKTVFPYSVLDVVLMGRIPHKNFFFRYSKSDIKIAFDVMDRLSISHLAERPYTEVSGGERQLTIIARALAQEADTLILDEPASGLDYGNQIRLLEEIVKLTDSGYTFIKSTHSPEHALWIADRVLMIKDGKIFADGRAVDVITGNNLQHLYNVTIDVAALNGSVKVCVPSRFLNRKL